MEPSRIDGVRRFLEEFIPETYADSQVLLLYLHLVWAVDEIEKLKIQKTALDGLPTK